MRPGGPEFFDRVAGRYDLINRVISLGLDQGWRRQLAAVTPAESRRILDVATGTADVALALATTRSDALVVGIDPSPGMLAEARPKAASQVPLIRGDGLRLPFGDGSFDACTIAFGLRNFPDRPAGLAELARVVRPGGVVAVLEGSEPRDAGPLAPLAKLYLHHAVPALGRLLGRGPGDEYRYLQRSIEAFPPRAEVLSMMQAAGLTDVEASSLSFGVAHLFTGRRAT